MDRRDEAVALAWNTPNVVVSGVIRREYPTEISNIDPQIAFINEGAWPSCGEQPFLSDEVACAFDKHSKDRKRPAADADGSVGVKENLPANQQFERSKPIF
jgi:hypothetical protein